MSANNFIHIRPEGIKSTRYAVDECDADTGDAYSHIGTFDSLEEAIQKANEAEKKSEDEGYEIEYGLKIDTK